MDKQKVIDTLKDLKNYVNENWEETEYGQEIKDANEALNIAVSTLSNSSFCGELMIDGKKYIVSKAPED